MKYKLIKEYPGSPILGSIVDNVTKSEFEEQFYPINQPGGYIYKHNIINFPEFWEEVIEKDYEILKVKTKFNHPNAPINKIVDSWLNVNLDYFDIHSVKRLSDGEIFTVGDMVNSTISDLGRATELTGFKLFDNKLKVGLRHLGYYPLFTIILPKPLFTTEDGVDIFEGDSFERVRCEDYKLLNQHTKSTSYDTIKYFSTKGAAEEYILMNKPCLSYNDVISVVPRLSEMYRTGLKQLIK